MLYAIAVIASGILIVSAQLVRRRRRLPINHDTLSRDAIISFGVGGVIAFGIVPTVVISVRFIEHGSKITPDVFAGFEPNQIILSLTIGTFFATIWTVKEYLERLRPSDTPVHPPAPAQQPPATVSTPRKRTRHRRKR